MQGLAATQILTGQRFFGPRQFRRIAIVDDVSTMAARPGAHIDNLVGGKNNLRVVFYHHQRVAGVAQSMQHTDNPVYISRVQTNAGFVEYEQGVNQRCT